MAEQQIDWSKLSKKERKALVKEQKRQRQEEQKRKGSIVKWVFIGGVGALALLGVVWVAGELSKPSGPMPGIEMPDQGRAHVSQAEWENFEYNSDPPTSGPHDAVWTKAGIYTEPQGDGHLVHSLEHGYVVISHNCEIKSQKSATESAEVEGVEEVGKAEEVDNKTCLEFVDKLKQRVEKDAWKLILVPRPNLDADFALTAWTRIDKFDTEEANMDRVENFISALRNKGPEKTME